MKIIRFFVFILAAWTISFSVSAQETRLSGKEIPAKIKSYVTKHFSDQKIIFAKKEQEHSKIKYEIKLDNRTELEFNQKMQVKEINGKSKLPDSVLPPKVLSYVKLHYPNNFITEWELDRKRQEVELDNDVSLKFNHSGKFLRIED